MADTNRASVAADRHKDFDRLTLIRVGAWGLAAFVSMTLVVYTAQTELGTKRAAAAVASIMSPPRDTGMTVTQVLARTAESEREARRMAEIVRSLSSERDRLVVRVDSVEREMDGLTGSINKAQQARPAQSDGKAPAPIAAPVISAPSITPTIKHAVVPPPPMAPEHAEVSSVSSATAATSAMLPAVPTPAIDPQTSQALWPRSGSLFTPPAKVATAIPATVPVSPAMTSPAMAPPSTPEEVLATMIAPTDMPQEIPLPRPSPLALLQATAMQIYAPAAQGTGAAPTSAALPPGEVSKGEVSKGEISKSDKIVPADTTGSVAAASAPENNEPQPKVEIGVDLGPALTIARLRTRWEAFKQLQSAVAEDIRPLISIREIKPGKPVELRLVVGPLADVAVAAKLCAALSGSQFPCQPAVFDGQRLALQ